MAKTYADLLQEVKGAIRQVSLEDLKSRLDSGEELILLDVREKDEWRQGHVPGAMHIPRGFLEMQSGSRLPDKDATIVTICAGGIRSAFAAKVLQDLGYVGRCSFDLVIVGRHPGEARQPGPASRCGSALRRHHAGCLQ